MVYCNIRGHLEAPQLGCTEVSYPAECGVCLYESHTCRLLRRLCRAKNEYRAPQWSACSRYLGLVGEDYDAHTYGRTAVLYEAATGRSMGPARSSEAAAVLAEDPHEPLKPNFSPDCGMLLITRERGDYQQRVHVLDMRLGGILAQIHMAGHACGDHDRFGIEQYAGAFILWHPSSRGLLLPGCHWKLLDPQGMLQRAGLIVGHCPLPAHLSEGSSFSPQGGPASDEVAERGGRPPQQSQVAPCNPTVC